VTPKTIDLTLCFYGNPNGIAIQKYLTSQVLQAHMLSPAARAHQQCGGLHSWLSPWIVGGTAALWKV
jgi:hypothetical protein